MGRNPHRWLVPFACILCAAATAAEPRIGKFVSYDTGDFIVYTSRSGSQARQLIGDLAKYRLTLEKVMGTHATRTTIPTQIVIVSAGDWNKYLQPRQNIAGWFQRGDFANYMTINGDTELSLAVHVIFHEYTHYYLSSQFAGEYPPWFHEGLAEVLGYAKFTDKGVAILQLPMFHVHEARDNDWIPFERLIKVDHQLPEYQSHEMNASFYAQSWLTVHYGLIENREFGAKMIRYLEQLNTLHPHDEAARNSFGDLAAADRLLREYSRSKHMSSGALKLGELPEVVLPVPKPVAENDALALIINLMLETHMGKERIGPLVESLIRREPKSARAQVLAARLALAADDTAAFDAATTAAEAAFGAEDWKPRCDLASVLLSSTSSSSELSLRPSSESERDLKRAYRWFAEALVKSNQDIECLWGFGTAAMRLEKNLDLADAALVAAYKRAPSNGNIAVSLATLKGKQEDFDGMIVYLKDAERFATNLSMRRWATDTLADIQRYLVERARVDEENRRQHEAYEKQRAEYEKKYGKKKKK